MITGVSFGYISYTNSQNDQVKLQQVTAIGTEIISTATRVNELGSNSWVTVDVSLPEEVLDIYTVENNTLVFDVATQGGIVSQPVFSPTAIMGITPVGNRTYVNDATLAIHSGRTRFRVTSQGSVVSVQMIS